MCQIASVSFLAMSIWATLAPRWPIGQSRLIRGLRRRNGDRPPGQPGSSDLGEARRLATRPRSRPARVRDARERRVMEYT
jgi:hypothetical protein